MPRRSFVHPDGPDPSEPAGLGQLTAAADAVVRTSVDLRSPAAADAVLDVAHLAHDVLLASAARRARA